jgi:hypothetical protein
MALLKAFLGVKPIQTAQQDEKYAFVFEGGI